MKPAPASPSIKAMAVWFMPPDPSAPGRASTSTKKAAARITPP